MPTLALSSTHCQRCEDSLEGLHSYGHNLEEHFCCICWFTLLAGDKTKSEVVSSSIREECEENGIDLKGDESTEEMLKAATDKRDVIEDEIDDLEAEIRGLERRRDSLESLIEKLEALSEGDAEKGLIEAVKEG